MLEIDAIETDILDYLRDELGAPSDLTPAAALFSNGTVDSFDLVRILSFLDERYGLEVSPLEVSLENFDSVRSMSALVVARLSGD
jgi:acyl carrier protein